MSGSANVGNMSVIAQAQLTPRPARAPQKQDALGAELSAVTGYGSSVTLEASDSISRRFSRGETPSALPLQASNDEQKEASGLATGSDREQGAVSRTFTATVTTKNGKIETFDLLGNTALIENEYGTMTRNAKAVTGDIIAGTDRNDVLINLTDDSLVDARASDDVLLNVGRRVALRGGAGDDSITSMADGAIINGESGDDTIVVLPDTIRHTLQKKVSLEEQDGVSKGLLRGVTAQTVTVDAGEGNDTVLVRPDIYQSTISGSAGNNVVDVGNVYDSRVDSGGGSDKMTGKTLVKSRMYAGGGEDTVEFEKVIDSRVFLEEGNDSARIGVMSNSSISGGDGSDFVEVATAEGSAFSHIETLRIHTYRNIIVDGVKFAAGQNDAWINGNKAGDGSIVNETV